MELGFVPHNSLTVFSTYLNPYHSICSCSFICCGLDVHNIISSVLSTRNCIVMQAVFTGMTLGKKPDAQSDGHITMPFMGKKFFADGASPSANECRLLRVSFMSDSVPY